MLVIGGDSERGLGQRPRISPAGTVTGIAVGIPLWETATRGGAQDKNTEHGAIRQVVKTKNGQSNPAAYAS